MLYNEIFVMFLFAAPTGRMRTSSQPSTPPSSSFTGRGDPTGSVTGYSILAKVYTKRWKV